MSQAPRPRTPIMPIGIIIVGPLVGIVGLFLLLVGAGVISPAVGQVLGINVDVQTATPGIIALVIGFGMAVSGALLARSRGATGMRKRELSAREDLNPEAYKERQSSDVWQSLGERLPYFS